MFGTNVLHGESMLVEHDRRAGHGRPPSRSEPFAYVAEPGLLAALGRVTFTFMCLRWQALWLFDALTGPSTLPPGRLAQADTSVVALRLQSASAEAPVTGMLHEQLRRWADDFADCADLYGEVQGAHPGADGLWTSPGPDAERVALANRPPDLLGHARRFEALAMEGRSLRRRLIG